MNTVYIAQYGWDYEGYDILGVYSTEESAQKACDDHKVEYEADNYRVISYCVED